MEAFWRGQLHTVNESEGCQWHCPGHACAKTGNQRKMVVQSNPEQCWTGWVVWALTSKGTTEGACGYVVWNQHEVLDHSSPRGTGKDRDSNPGLLTWVTALHSTCLARTGLHTRGPRASQYHAGHPMSLSKWALGINWSLFPLFDCSSWIHLLTCSTRAGWRWDRFETRRLLQTYQLEAPALCQ